MSQENASKQPLIRYGNRLSQNVTAGSGPSNSVGVDPTTNRINSAGYAYDAAGNMTNDGLNAMVYDGENHVASSTQASVTTNYTYDGNGLRLEKATGSNSTVYIFSGAKVVAEYDNGAVVTAPSREYIYAGGQLLSTIDSAGTKYHLSGHLSPHITTDASGNVIGTQAHYPFGEKWYETGTATKFKFTSYERDPETGNDYAIMRYHINRLGRFGSVDRLAGSIWNPQSLNRYAYVLNNPVNLVDPLGLCEGPTAPVFDGGDCGGGGGGADGGGAPSDPTPPDPAPPDLGPPPLPTDPVDPIGLPNPQPDPPSDPGNATNCSVGGVDGICTTHSENGGGDTNGAPPDEVTFGSDVSGSPAEPQGNGGDRISTAKGLARYKILLNDKCRAFIEKLLNFLYGGPQTAVSIANRLDQATFNNSSSPSTDIPNANATTALGTYSATIYPAGAAQLNSGLAVTMIHETFHMGPGAKTDIQMWQAAIGNRNISLANTPENEGKASSSWGQKLRDNCN